MFRLNLFLLLVYLSSAMGGILEQPLNLPCKLNDVKCVTDVIHWVVGTTLQGVPELGIKSLDPSYKELIEGNLGYIKYKLKKSNIEGMKTCKINKSSVNSNATSMHMEFLCRRAHMDGEYDIDGNLLSYPLKGQGIFNIDITNYLCLFDTGLSYFEQKGKLHAKLELNTYKCEVTGEVDLDIRTLDNKKILSEAALTMIRLAQTNSKLFLRLLDGPIHTSNLKNFFKFLNKRLKMVPITDLLQVNDKM